MSLLTEKRRTIDMPPGSGGMGLGNQLRVLADALDAVASRRESDAREIEDLRRQVAILWDVAYEGLGRGDAFYGLVQRRTGQTREQVEHHFTATDVK